MNYEPSSSVSYNVQVFTLRRGKVVNNPTLARKIKQKALQVLQSGKNKRKARLKKRKVKHKSSSDAKLRKSKVNSTKSGRVCKRKSSKSDLNKKKNSKVSAKGVLSDEFNKSGSSMKAQEINKNKRGLLYSEASERLDISKSKSLKLTTPSTSKFVDNDNTFEQNTWSLQEGSEKTPQIPVIGKTDENKFQITCCRTEDILPDEIREEFKNSFSDAEAKFLSCGELHSHKQSQTNISDAVNCSKEPGDVNLMDNSEMYNALLIELITDEFNKQDELAEENLRIGKKSEKLLSDSDCEILKKFFELSDSAGKLFVRMLGRKKSWHRVNTITYKEISDNLEKEFKELHNQNYMDSNIDGETLKTQLQLLSKPEVFNICKKFKVSLKALSSGKKEDYINAIIRELKQQRSVEEMFKPKNFDLRIDRLKKDIKETLGMCVKLNNKTLETFHKVLLLNSFAHYKENEEQRFTKVLQTHLCVKKYNMKFPDYKVCPTTVFETQADFEEYKKALLLHDSCEIAMRNKDFNKFECVCFEAKEKFQQILEDNEYKNRLVNLKPFLLKFTAGAIYAKILTNYCTKFQRKINRENVKAIAKLLLGQDLFLRRKKGDWYEILSKTLENQKEYNAGAEVLIEALKDPLVSEVQRVTLQLRGQAMLRKQNCGIKDIHLQGTLKGFCTLFLSEPNEIEITGLALAGNQAGQKIIYIQKSQNEVALTSVEERAISYYKGEGYTKGYHSEGLIVQTLYFLIFFDIIYGVSPEGVFQSPYQDAPLDFYSSCFSNSRKEELELLLNDMLEWDDKKIEDKIRFAYNKNNGCVCLIKWDTGYTADDLCEVAKCITAPKLVLIFQRFINNFREVRAGFPDLTLWNPESKKCIFVEVKSPTDKLSPAQRVWLTFLSKIGLNCQVCHVKNVSSKSCM